MRINRYVATATGISRRKVDQYIKEGRVEVDYKLAINGQDVKLGQKVTLNKNLLSLPTTSTTILLNKPVGYVVSRSGQGSQTVYDILPDRFKNLKPIGRLDKDSHGLLLMSSDGDLIQQLTHPSNRKVKVYELVLNKKILQSDIEKLSRGVLLEDGLSSPKIIRFEGKHLTVSLEEGRNRQLRRTFNAIGYDVIDLKRIAFGSYVLGKLKAGEYKEISNI